MGNHYLKLREIFLFRFVVFWVLPSKRSASIHRDSVPLQSAAFPCAIPTFRTLPGMAQQANRSLCPGQWMARPLRTSAYLPQEGEAVRPFLSLCSGGTSVVWQAPTVCQVLGWAHLITHGPMFQRNKLRPGDYAFVLGC
jgi:hypothetical protein